MCHCLQDKKKCDLNIHSTGCPPTPTPTPEQWQAGKFITQE